MSEAAREPETEPNAVEEAPETAESPEEPAEDSAAPEPVDKPDLPTPKKDQETLTEGTVESVDVKPVGPIVSSTKKSRPPYKYDKNKITLRFLFANRDGLTVTVECDPSDTVGEVKGALLSVWPEGTRTRQ